LLAGFLLRARLALLVTLVPLVWFAGLYGPRFLPAPAAAAEQLSFRVLSFNIATGAGRGQPEPVVRLARAVGADLVCLQEVPGDALATIGAALLDEYPYQTGSGDGVILSRGPILAAQPYQPQTGAHDGLLAEVVVGDRVVTIVNAHLWLASSYADWRRGWFRLARGFDTERRDRAAAELVERLKERGGPRVLVGDFNMTPGSAAYQILTAELRDSYAEAGWGLGHTVPANMEPAAPNLSLPLFRVDYIFHSADLAARRAWVGPYTNSNHLPVVADLAFR
jgi:vancomycin resistance protein VanJ